MQRSLLITRPEHDVTTRYLSRWSEKILKKAEEKGVGIVDLCGNKANRNRVIGILEKRKPKLVALNGYGGGDFVAGHDDEIILGTGDGEAVKFKIVCARSCKSAKVLGQSSITQRASSFLGYKEDFVFMYNPERISRPLKDKTAALFLGPSNHIVISLLKGHSTGCANNKSKMLFRKNLEKLLIEGPSSDDYDAIRFLYWDMSHQVCLGDKSAVF